MASHKISVFCFFIISLFLLPSVTSAENTIHISGEPSEVVSITNGAAVTPTVGPLGTLVIKNNGTTTFAGGYLGQAVAFGLGGQQNVNTSYYQFTGSNIGNLFYAEDGEISFRMKSSLSFAERKNLPQQNFKYAFDVRDGSNQRVFTFFVQTINTSGGRLLFHYSAKTSQTSYYYVPIGQEDQVFGKDVIMNVRITWDESQSKLFINDSLVKTFNYTQAVSPNWNSSSKFIFGADHSGNYSSTDFLDEFLVNIEGGASTTPPTNPVLPTITNFSANPISIVQSGTSTLSWSTASATSVQIQGFGLQAINGSIIVSPATTTVYTLSASNQYGTTTATTTVTVTPVTVPPDNGIPYISNMSVLHQNGQTFITWQDVAQGTSGQNYRYDIYRSSSPITNENISSATLVHKGIFNNSGQRFGFAPFLPATRVNASNAMSSLTPMGATLPLWSGLAVYTPTATSSSYYAVVTRDISKSTNNTSLVASGINSSPSAVSEFVSSIEPIKYQDSNQTSTYKITGAQGLPLMLKLHASSAGATGVTTYGDIYQYFGDSTMGYQDGIPSIFSVYEVSGANRRIELYPRDTVWTMDALAPLETYWFGYNVVPLNASDGVARVYPFTENRLLHLIDWVAEKYGVDTNRIYSTGQSMGGWGTTSFAFRRPDIFAAVYPILPRFESTTFPNMVLKTYSAATLSSPTLPDQTTSYVDHMNSVDFASRTHTDLPFIGWAIGRNDGYASWYSQVNMARVLDRNRHGYAFSWNNGDHSGGAAAMSLIYSYYEGKFAKNKSYPAFSESSINSKMGDGNPAVGDLVGGVNLGFYWSPIVETANTWSTSFSNNLIPNNGPMTVSVTPRRTQNFDPGPGDVINWTTSTGHSGSVVTDKYGLVTIKNVQINKNATTTLSLVNTYESGSMPDVDSPTRPVVTASVTSPYAVELSWGQATDDVAVLDYVIYRNGVEVGSTTSTNFTDTGVAPATNYSYVVASRDTSYNLSDYSTLKYVTTWSDSSGISGLISRWSFDNGSVSSSTVFDATNTHPMSIAGSLPTTSGKIGEAGVFGSGNFLAASSTVLLKPLNAMTISSWVNFVAGTTTDYVVSKSKSSWSYSMHVAKGSNTFSCRFTVTNPSNYVDVSWQTTSPVFQTYLNRWTLLTCSYDGSVAKLYVDGVLKSTKTFVASLLHNNDELLIGNRQPTNNLFNGLIDDVRIYNRALSDNDVLNIFNLQN